MGIWACLAASIILAILAWRKGWRKMALVPVLCLFIIAVVDAALDFALSDISGFSLIVGIVCVTWLVYMVFKTPKTATWYMRNYARGISTFFISLWVLLAISYATDTIYQAPSHTNEGMVLWAFLLVTLVSVIISWRREGIGGLMLTIIGLAAIVVFMLTNKPKAYWITLVTGAPFLVSGILYLKCWRRIKKSKIPRPVEGC